MEPPSFAVCEMISCKKTRAINRMKQHGGLNNSCIFIIASWVHCTRWVLLHSCPLCCIIETVKTTPDKHMDGDTERAAVGGLWLMISPPSLEAKELVSSEVGLSIHLLIPIEAPFEFRISIRYTLTTSCWWEASSTTKLIRFPEARKSTSVVKRSQCWTCLFSQWWNLV